MTFGLNLWIIKPEDDSNFLWVNKMQPRNVNYIDDALWSMFFYRWGDTDWYHRRDRGKTEAVERYLSKHKDSRLSEQKQIYEIQF